MDHPNCNLSTPRVFPGAADLARLEGRVEGFGILQQLRKGNSHVPEGRHMPLNTQHSKDEDRFGGVVGEVDAPHFLRVTLGLSDAKRYFAWKTSFFNFLLHAGHIG